MIPPIPRSPKRAISDDRDLLGWLIERLSHTSRTQIGFTGLSKERFTVLTSALPLLRYLIDSARAIHQLSGSGHSESGYTVCRSMLETRATLAYLVENPEDPTRAITSQIWTLMVLESPPGKPRRETGKALAHFKAQVPALYTQTAGLFKKNRYGHYSGLGWTRLVKDYGGVQGPWLYGFLSWFTHAIAHGTSQFRLTQTQQSAYLSFSQVRPDAEARADICVHATNILHEGWLEYHNAFGEFGRRRGRHKRAS